MTPYPERTKTVLSPTEALRALLYPVTNGVVVAAILVFGLLLWIVSMAGLLGAWLLIVVVPALVRFQVIVLEARSRSVNPQPPGIEFFTFIGNAWTLFPIVHIAFFAAGVYVLGESFGLGAVVVFGLIIALVYPASLIVLALTHSPLESIHPLAIAGVMERVGFGYIVLPLFFVFGAAAGGLFGQTLPASAQIYVNLLISFSFMSLTGSVIAPFELEKEIEPDEPVEQSAEERAAGLAKQRTSVLNHAYGFVSRDNRSGGMNHILSWIQRDPEPKAAWPWFFEQMLAWERKEAALYFAQHYLKRLLGERDRITAVKVMMRCRLVNELFKPFEDDIELAIDAAYACDNRELASFLESSAKR